MESTACLLCSLITLAMFLQVQSIPTVTGMYGETIEVPCNNGSTPPNLFFTKWKYEKAVGSPGDLLIKHAHKEEATVQASDGYMNRISIAANYSLLISHGTLSDQRTFTCMVVSGTNLHEYSVEVRVYKTPSPPQITNKAKQLENAKMTTLGMCVVKDANPAADITWSKNGQPLVADGKTVIITPSVTEDPESGLLTTSSTLQYATRKNDKGARFTCVSKHLLVQQESAPETFNIHYPTENVVLRVSPTGPIREGDNVTLKCEADGNPPPSGFNFHLKGQKVTVRGSDTHTLTAVTRMRSGEYKCSLLGDEKIESSANIAVSYLDFSLSPSGTVLKTVGDMLDVKIEKNASGEAKVTWTKDGKMEKEGPVFHKLKYTDTGLYKCEMEVAGIKRSQSFTLVVEGNPVIKKLTKQHSEDGTHNLVCEAEGAPQPSVQWSVNGTNEQSSYHRGKATYKITVVPTANQTVTCVVSNKLGEDVMAINISTLFKEEIHDQKGSQEEGNDQAILIVGVVVGLIIAAALVGLIYWIYMKKSRQGTWKTNEKESGTSEESKKLEETNHKGDVV